MFGSRFGGTNGVVYSVFEFINFGFADSFDFEDGHTSNQFSESFLEFLFVVARSGCLNGFSNFFDSFLDCSLFTGTFALFNFS